MGGGVGLLTLGCQSSLARVVLLRQPCAELDASS